MQRSEDMIEVQTDDWRTTVVFLVSLFVGGSVILIAWGIWDLLESNAAQEAFSTAIRSLGYGLTSLLVLLGLGAAAYGFGTLLRSAAPLYLARGVKDHGGVFRSDGLVVTLPRNFEQLPEVAQREIVRSLIQAQSNEARLLTAADLRESVTLVSQKRPYDI